MNPERTLLREYATRTSELVVRRVVAELRRMKKEDLPEDDSEAENLWDEICDQIHSEGYEAWGSSEEKIISLVRRHISSLQHLELEAIWLQATYDEDWPPDGEDIRTFRVPASADEVVDYFTMRIFLFAAESR